jgi:S1-C subfamily serine protease
MSLLVADVLPGGPGAAAGLRSGDPLLALEGRPLQQPADLARGLAGAQVDQSVTLRVRTRERRERTVKATLVEEGDGPMPGSAAIGCGPATSCAS